MLEVGSISGNSHDADQKDLKDVTEKSDNMSCMCVMARSVFSHYLDAMLVIHIEN